ncbi:hypothetical protein IMZ48_45220 [Candidatus Bathyarchaeota archaeon]|nr:hypothetical protein [Candidatus Bathyarchaeota archaeon]
MATDIKHEDQPDLREKASAPEPAKAGQKVTFWAILLGSVASIGGFMFGYVR